MDDKEKAKRVKMALDMVNIETSEKAAFVAAKTIFCLEEKGEEFSLKDAARILAEAEDIFPDETQ